MKTQVEFSQQIREIITRARKLDVLQNEMQSFPGRTLTPQLERMHSQYNKQREFLELYIEQFAQNLAKMAASKTPE